MEMCSAERDINIEQWNEDEEEEEDEKEGKKHTENLHDNNPYRIIGDFPSAFLCFYFQEMAFIDLKFIIDEFGFRIKIDFHRIRIHVHYLNIMYTKLRKKNKRHSHLRNE